MQKLLSKILNFRFSSLLPKNKYLAKDFEIIDRAFNLDTLTIKTDRQLIQILPTLINEIADKIHISFDFYEAVKNKNSDWIDQLSEFKYSKYVKDHADEIFKNGIILNSLGSFPGHKENEPSSFISGKIGGRHFYIISIEESKWHNYYSQIFFSSLSKLVKSVKELQERRKLEDQVSSIQLALDEKEKSLQIAEKAVKRKVYDLHNLVEASNEIYSILNFRQLINSALLTVIGQVGVQSAFVLM